MKNVHTHACMHMRTHTGTQLCLCGGKTHSSVLSGLWQKGRLEEESEGITKGITRRTTVEVRSWIWRVLTCVNFLIRMAVKWPERLYIPSLCLLECLNQDRTRRGSEPLYTTCCLDPSVDPALGRMTREDAVTCLRCLLFALNLLFWVRTWLLITDPPGTNRSLRDVFLFTLW